MKKNKKISIVIPTYNRASFLNECISRHLDIIRDFDVDLYIYDNKSIDETKKISLDWVNKINNIFYVENYQNLGSDANIERGLKEVKGDYIWLLGDTYAIPYPAFLEVYKLVNEREFDVILTNLSSRVIGIAGGVYTNQNKLLGDLGWHMTCMSCIVYNTEILKKANFERYKDTRFNQLGIIFENFEYFKNGLLWLPHLNIETIKLANDKKVGWQNIVFHVWAIMWQNFIFSLPPSYNLDAKIKCITDHNQKSNIFSYKNMIYYRMNNFYNLTSFTKYIRYIKMTTKKSTFMYFIISILPKDLIKYFYNIIK